MLKKIFLLKVSLSILGLCFNALSCKDALDRVDEYFDVLLKKQPVPVLPEFNSLDWTVVDGFSVKINDHVFTYSEIAEFKKIEDFNDKHAKISFLTAPLTLEEVVKYYDKAIKINPSSDFNGVIDDCWQGLLKNGAVSEFSLSKNAFIKYATMKGLAVGIIKALFPFKLAHGEPEPKKEDVLFGPIREYNFEVCIISPEQIEEYKEGKLALVWQDFGFVSEKKLSSEINQAIEEAKKNPSAEKISGPHKTSNGSNYLVKFKETRFINPANRNNSEQESAQFLVLLKNIEKNTKIEDATVSVLGK